jgi:hypothetical protein
MKAAKAKSEIGKAESRNGTRLLIFISTLYFLLSTLCPAQPFAGLATDTNGVVWMLMNNVRVQAWPWWTTNSPLTNYPTFGVLINLTQLGTGADSTAYGAAFGENAKGSSHGVAVGGGAIGQANGVAVGESAQGFSDGVAIGSSCNGSSAGVAVEEASNGSQVGVAIGQFANGAGTGNVAIGGDIEGDNPALIPTGMGFFDTVELGRGTAVLNGGLNFRGHGIMTSDFIFQGGGSGLTFTNAAGKRFTLIVNSTTNGFIFVPAP